MHRLDLKSYIMLEVLSDSPGDGLVLEKLMKEIDKYVETQKSIAWGRGYEEGQYDNDYH